MQQKRKGARTHKAAWHARRHRRATSQPVPPPPRKTSGKGHLNEAKEQHTDVTCPQSRTAISLQNDHPRRAPPPRCPGP